MTKLTKTLMKTLTRITAFALLALSGVYFLRINSPYALRMNSASRLGLFLPKILAGSLAPFIVLAGAMSGLLAFLLRMPTTGAMAGLATLLAGRYTRRASAAHEGFDRAFGPGWEQKIPPTWLPGCPTRGGSSACPTRPILASARMWSSGPCQALRVRSANCCVTSGSRLRAQSRRGWRSSTCTTF
jgi:hypothetical protein